MYLPRAAQPPAQQVPDTTANHIRFFAYGRQLTVSQQCMVLVSDPGPASRAACKLRSTQVADSGPTVTAAWRMCARKDRTLPRSEAAAASVMPHAPTAPVRPHVRRQLQLRWGSACKTGTGAPQHEPVVWHPCVV